MSAKRTGKEKAAACAAPASAAPACDEPLKLRLGCCSGIHFLDGAEELRGLTDPRPDCKSRNVCCKGRKIRFRDTETCV